MTKLRCCKLCNNVFSPTSKNQKICVKEDELHHMFFRNRKRNWCLKANKVAYKTTLKNRNNRRLFWLQKYKCAKGCFDCGYNSFGVALDFDHIDPKTKILAVSKLTQGNLKRLFEEIRKCEVVCANCHRVRTQNNNA